MKKNKTFHKKKIWIVFGTCTLLLLGLGGRLVYLMGFRSDYYYEKAEDLFLEAIEIEPKKEEPYVKLVNLYLDTG